MGDDKVVKLHEHHKTFRSMAGEAAEDLKATRGVVIYFEEDGTMYFGEKDLRLADLGMMIMYLQMAAVHEMSEPR